LSHRLPLDASDKDLIEFADRWAVLMEAENYEAAYAFTDHDPEMGWSPSLMKEVARSYGDARPGQKVTVERTPTDIRQRKEVTRWPRNSYGTVGEIWYDLSIDRLASDLTATFAVFETSEGLVLKLNDIHVM